MMTQEKPGFEQLLEAVDLNHRPFVQKLHDHLLQNGCMPREMVESIEGASICKRLAYNTCSPKCTGYDVVIGGQHFQKCRYGGFEFLVTEESGPFIRAFVEHELEERAV